MRARTRGAVNLATEREFIHQNRDTRKWRSWPRNNTSGRKWVQARTCIDDDLEYIYCMCETRSNEYVCTLGHKHITATVVVIVVKTYPTRCELRQGKTCGEALVNSRWPYRVTVGRGRNSPSPRKVPYGMRHFFAREAAEYLLRHFPKARRLLLV